MAHSPPQPRRRRTTQGNAPAAALSVAAIAAMLYGGFTMADDPEPGPLPQHAQPQAAPPSVRDTVRGRVGNTTPRRVARPIRFESRFTGPGVLEVWGSASAPDGATIRVHVRRAAGGRWLKLADAPVAGGHFLVRKALAQGLQGQPIRVRARLG